MRSAIVAFAAIHLGLLGTHQLRADIPPVRILEKDVRGLLPPDGQLIEDKQPGKQYIGVALNRYVRAAGKQVIVTSQPIGDGGIVFREGFIEVNAGVHAEHEVHEIVGNPTVAINAAFSARIYLTDDLRVVVHPYPIGIAGDNFAGKLATGIDQLVEAALKQGTAQANQYADKLTAQIREKVPQGAAFHVDIHPGYVLATLGARPGGAAAPARPWEFLGFETEQTGEDIVWINGATRPVAVHKGETIEVPITLDIDGFFHWGHDDRTRPAHRDTTVVVVHRSPAGREMVFYCFNDHRDPAPAAAAKPPPEIHRHPIGKIGVY